uniref:Uncharacterized protein n=1 Tax=Picea sitchensis TaxID=3332 RepID=A9NR58_PICSI|nr:unknown [Picea sitchensis]
MHPGGHPPPGGPPPPPPPRPRRPWRALLLDFPLHMDIYIWYI